MSGGPPLVSVVIPTYRSAGVVERTVESVLAQTYPALEVVVADHSSPDGTWDVLQQYRDDARVRLLQTPSGGGAERNWNRVTDEATGAYLKLVCQDDLVAPTCVADQAAVLLANPGVALVACRRDVIDVADRRLVRSRGLGRMAGVVDGGTAIRSVVRAGTNLLGEPACVMMRTEAVRRAGGWSAQDPYVIDQDLYLKVLETGDLFAQRETLAAFRVSSTQWSVALAGAQAAQVASLHRRVLGRRPDLVSPTDERLGSGRALLTAWARRGAYLVWRRRMREAAAAG